jgi:hypothetical protein
MTGGLIAKEFPDDPFENNCDASSGTCPGANKYERTDIKHTHDQLTTWKVLPTEYIRTKIDELEP